MNPQTSFRHQGEARRMLSASLVATMVLVFASGAWAQRVSAALSQSDTSVGEPVQLNISIEDAEGKPPQELKVDGFDIQLIGKSRQVNIVNFQVKTAAVFSYRVVPLKAGDFVIPAFSVTLNGRTYNTEPLPLSVADNPGGVPSGSGTQNFGGISPPTQSAPPPSGPPPVSEGKLAFAELIVPKKTAYAGEVVPVELRFYFAANHPTQISAPNPNFAGNGFTVLNFSKPIQREQEIDGQPYTVVIFQTAVTPIKAGELEVPPASIDAQMQLPGRAPANLDDFFGNFLNSSGLGGELRSMKVSTKSLKLDVKPLPDEGRPEDFGGAIGQFSMTAAASPKKADPGEPVSLSLVVSGRGNFDGMGTPTLVDADAWKTYPPSEKFKASPSDPIGYNGQKTFEYTMVARSDTNQTPSPEFSFFDPAVGKYVTLKSTPIPVIAKAGGVAAPTPSTVAAVSSTPGASSTPPPVSAPSPAPSDSLVEHLQPASFEPFALSSGFITANEIAIVAWLAVVCFGLGRAATHSTLARRAAQRRDAKRLLSRVDDPAATAEEVIQNASEFVRFRLAPEGSVLDTRELLERSSVSASMQEKIGALLDRGDEWRYSTSGLSSRLGAEERQQIVNQLKSFDEELPG